MLRSPHSNIMKKQHSSWIELDIKKLHHNIQVYKKHLPAQINIAAVIKSNAYGHGIIEIAQHLEKTNSVQAFCVVTSKEGLLLREKNITKRIICIGILNISPELIVQKNIEQTIHTIEQAQQLHNAAQKQNTVATIHIKIDTGLSRMGIFSEDVDQFIHAIEQLKNIRIGSIFSHFSKAYDISSTKKQKKKFESLSHKYPTHLLSSKSHFTDLEKNHELIRIGIGLYGYVLHQPERNKQLKPILSLKSRIEMIKTIPKGSTVGYDHTCITKKETKIAILPIGYAEGLPLELANQGSVIICNKLAPILGKISMNYTVVDITNIPECTIKDHAILIGNSKDHSISCIDWMKLSGQTPTHLTTNLKSYIPRICIK